MVCMLAAMQAGAQVRISGTVREKDGGPLQSAVVLYVPAGQEGSEYAITDGMGKFSLELEAAPAAGDSLRVSMLGYGTVTVAPEAGTEMEILLSEEAISIQEVVVRAPKVKLYGDTVEFNVQSFAEAQDKSLSDVLKRMPGVEVGEDGEISYNGESLGNLYVEGMDLLGGRYSLLTKNISARDVKSVEIIEKHQPVKALSGISSGDKPAINLKLQESAKGKWVGSANLAGGVSSAPEALWDANLFLMRVGRKWQSVNNIKTNNIGKELKSELNGYGILGSAADNRPSGFVSIGTGSAPLDADRVSFNQSGIINSSNNFKTEDWKLNASVSYSFDRLESGNSSSTTYYFEDGEKTVLEGNEAMTREHFLQGRFEAEANRPDFYFRNVLSAEAGYSDGLVSMTGEYPNRQKAIMPYISVGDDLRYTGRRGNRAFTVYSSNRFAMGNEDLTVIREDGVQKQDVGIRDFRTDTYVSTDFKVSPRLGLGLKGGLEASVRSLESLLEGVDTAGLGLAGASFSNCLTAAFVRPYISPDMEYNSRHWELRLSAPVSYARYWFADADMFIYRTFGSVKYIPGPKLSFTVSGSASNSALDIDDFYTGYILQNYRYMQTGFRQYGPGRVLFRLRKNQLQGSRKSLLPGRDCPEILERVRHVLHAGLPGGLYCHRYGECHEQGQFLVCRPERQHGHIRHQRQGRTLSVLYRLFHHFDTAERSPHSLSFPDHRFFPDLRGAFRSMVRGELRIVLFPQYPLSSRYFYLRREGPVQPYPGTAADPCQGPGHHGVR